MRRRTARCRCCCTCTAAASSSAALETHDSLCRQLALRSGGAVLALDYRLAPEHPFPAARRRRLGRAAAGCARRRRRWGWTPTRLAVGGDSAGGTLAAVCALHARDIGLPLALQLLITPGTAAHADTRVAPAVRPTASCSTRPTSTGSSTTTSAHHHRRDWRFAPLEAPDVDGVAPACVLLAECDPLVDEGLAYADRLRAAGVPVQLELVRGVTHDFIKMGRALKEAGAGPAGSPPMP